MRKTFVNNKTKNYSHGLPIKRYAYSMKMLLC